MTKLSCPELSCLLLYSVVTLLKFWAVIYHMLKLSALFTADPVTKSLGNNIIATVTQETSILKSCCSCVCVPVLAGLFVLAERWKLPVLVSPALHTSLCGTEMGWCLLACAFTPSAGRHKASVGRSSSVQ